MWSMRKWKKAEEIITEPSKMPVKALGLEYQLTRNSYKNNREKFCFLNGGNSEVAKFHCDLFP